MHGNAFGRERLTSETMPCPCNAVGGHVSILRLRVHAPCPPGNRYETGTDQPVTSPDDLVGLRDSAFVATSPPAGTVTRTTA